MINEYIHCCALSEDELCVAHGSLHEFFDRSLLGCSIGVDVASHTAIVQFEALTLKMQPLISEGIVECCRTEADNTPITDLLAAIKQDKVSLIDQQEAIWIDLGLETYCLVENHLLDIDFQKLAQLDV